MLNLFGTAEATPRPDRPSRLEAPGLARAGGLQVAIRGRPFWRGGLECPASPEFAAAVLEAWRREGPALLQRLHGAFALAIVDDDAGDALLAIDRMGIERLAYAAGADRLVFSTSAEAVAREAGSPVLDHAALFSYLFFHMIPSPQTAFAGVAKLPAATLLRWRKGRAELSRYWEAPFVEDGASDIEPLAVELRESLRTAVRAARPDHCTGAFLSGGLDSSTVAGVLAEVGPAPARTFTIGFGYADYDELAYSRIANSHFGCEGHEYTVTGADIADSLPQIARAYDEPFGNSSALPAYHCARMARDAGITHLLAGDGGDELFAGNSRYVEQRVFEWYRNVPAPLRTGLVEPLLEHWPRSLDFWLTRKGRSYLEKARTSLPERFETWNFVHRLGPAAILESDFLASIDPLAPLQHMAAVWRAAPCRSTLNRMLFYDWRFTLADNDLRKVQTTADMAGIAVSYPMLHPDVVEMSMRVPPAVKLPGNRLRDFYKQAMRGFLPDEIIRKRKHGFGLPFGLWLQDSPALRERIQGNLADLRARRIIRSEFIDRLLDLHGADDARYYGVFVWVLAMLEEWLRRYQPQNS